MSISDKRLAELAARSDDKIDYSDIPELNEEFWANAKLVEPEGTQQVTLRVKKSVLDALRAPARAIRPE